MLKKIFAVLLVAILLGGSAFAYSYWDNLEKTQSETITIGEGKSVTVSANASAQAGKVLVPAGVVLGTNDVESYVLTYDVALDNQAASDLVLGVTSSNVLIGGVSTYSSLVNINISLDQTALNADSTVVVTVTVTLTEPADEAAYNAVINSDITFDLTFTATVA